MNFNINTNQLGKIFFAASVLIFILMIISPLNHLVIFSDEFFTFAVVKFDIPNLINITANDVHPPLYYLILKGVAKVLTAANIPYDTIFVTKLISIAPYGLILLFSAFKFQKSYGWLSTGIFTLSLSLFSEFFSYFLIARMYSWALLFLLISFYYYKNILKDWNMKNWMLFTLFSVLGAYTHYFAAISSVILYLILFTFILKNKKDEIRNFILCVILGILAYVPWILTLLNQINYVHEYFWIQDLTLKDLIDCLSYYATSNTSIIIESVAILFLILVIIILLKQYRDFENDENFLILSGICAFIGTIILGSIISLTYKPILIPRYLIPVSSLLWVSISILVGRIKDSKLLIVSLALILLLALSGVNDIIESNNHFLETGNEYEKVLNDVNNNADIIIINTGGGLMEFSDYFDNVEIYSLKVDNAFNVENKKFHEIYNFKELNSTKDIDDLINSNPNKNIYFLDAWGHNHLKSFNKTAESKLLSDVVFYKFKTD